MRVSRDLPRQLEGYGVVRGQYGLGTFPYRRKRHAGRDKPRTDYEELGGQEREALSVAGAPGDDHGHVSRIP